MMQRLRTCSELAAIAAMTIAVASGATVSGNIQITSAAEHQHGAPSDLSDIVVWLEMLKGVPTQPVQAARARLLQKNKMFSPHVLVIPVGTVVEFPNADPIFHNAFSNYNGELFDVGLYPPGTTRSVRFRKTGIVHVFCNIHPAMAAIIIVLDTPYFTKAKRDGSYEISDVPPGSYELHVFDERATGTASKLIEVSVSSEEAEVQPPLVKISEDGYAPLPHKNKYGRDYPADKDLEKYTGVPR